MIEEYFIFVKKNLVIFYILSGILQLLLGMFFYYETSNYFLLVTGLGVLSISYWYMNKPSIVLHPYHLEAKLSPFSKSLFLLYSEIKTIKLFEDKSYIYYKKERIPSEFCFQTKWFSDEDLNLVSKCAKLKKRKFKFR